jgi:hypothetical protein
VLHQLSLFRAELREDRLQRCYWTAAGLALAHLKHYVSLGLLHIKHRTDRPAALGHNWIELPGTTNQAADGTANHLFSKQQGAMAGTVLAGDTANLRRLWTGVIQATDQIVDAGAAGIDQQQHRGAGGSWSTEQGAPGIGWAVEIGKGVGGNCKGMELGAG